MAPLINSPGHLEEGGINRSEEAAEGDRMNNEAHNNNTFVRWHSLYVGSVIVVWMCILYNMEKGSLPTSAMWLEGIAVVVMFVSCCGSICTIGTTSPHESEDHGLEESRNEL
jgi:hypothetical protein